MTTPADHPTPVRGLVYLFGWSLRRMLLSRKTAAVAGVVGLCGVISALWTWRVLLRESDEIVSPPLLRWAEDLLVPLHVGFLLPLTVLLYAAAAWGDERERRTLLHLVMRPLPRWGMYLARAAAVLPLAALAGVAGLLALAVGTTADIRDQALGLFVPAVAAGAVTYAALFLMVGALLRRPVVVSVLYAFFVESLVGAMPGTVKWLTVSYHVKVLLYAADGPDGLEPDRPLLFLAVSPATAWLVLSSVTLVLLAGGAVLFGRRQYRDLE